MKRVDEWLNKLDDLYFALKPKSILMIGNNDSVISEYFIKRNVTVWSYGIDNFEENDFPESCNIAILDELILKLETPQLNELINKVCKNCPCIVIYSLSDDSTEILQQISRVSNLMTSNNKFRDFESTGLFSPFIVYRNELEVGQTIACYEESLLLLKLEIERRTDLILELENREATQSLDFSNQIEMDRELPQKNQALLKINKEQVQKNQELRQKNEQLEFAINAFWSSRTGNILKSSAAIRHKLFPTDSLREQILLSFLSGLKFFTRTGFRSTIANVRSILRKPGSEKKKTKNKLILTKSQGKILQILPIESSSPVKPHQEEVSIVVCVHNALEHVRQCLDSIQSFTSTPYELILVDDGSEEDTVKFLKHYSETRATKLFRNEIAQGYTCAANQGIKLSVGEFIVLLNSDTIVTSAWLDRMIACAKSSECIGVVGPLSNTASYQSIPEYESKGDWAENPLPENISIQEMGRMVSNFSQRIYPEMPLLNGFCLLIRRKLIDEIGYFDEDNFGRGYGEEDDFNLRARAAGWKLKLADDVYIYHAQSKSYSNEKRIALSERAGKILRAKHGPEIINESVNYMQFNRILESIRARSRVLYKRENAIREGRLKFSKKKVLFVLPIAVPGGGGNVVVYEANAMSKMGVNPAIFNLIKYKESFLNSYPGLEIPVVFGEIDDLAAIAADYDAIIATANYSVNWFEKLPPHIAKFRGYYVQGFEPLMYAPDSPEFKLALQSYTLIPEMKCFSKTEWTKRMVYENTGRNCKVVGASVDIDLMHPRPRILPEWPQRPIRIAAMIRPESPYREPEKSMRLLKEASNKYNDSIEAVIFGTTQDEPGFQNLTQDFNWSLYGILSQRQTANLMNEIDIFIDYSSHQAMGLTALEAMSCGCAVILPLEGGAASYARDRENSLIVDTKSYENVWGALQELIENHELRKRIQRNALYDACNYYPEMPALNILEILFEDRS